MATCIWEKAAERGACSHDGVADSVRVGSLEEPGPIVDDLTVQSTGNMPLMEKAHG